MGINTKMEVNLNIKKSDLLLMNWLLLFKMKANLLWLLILFTAAGFGALDSISNNGVLVWAAITSVVALLMFIITLTLGTLIQLIFASAEKGFIGPTTYKLTDEYFEEKTIGTETKTRWKSILASCKFKNYFFLRINGYRVHIVPKREFESNEEFDKFCHYVQDKLKIT